MTQRQLTSEHFPLLSLGQYLASLLVILIHCGRLTDNDLLHFFFKSILCRLAVPLFLVTTGYFYRQRLSLSPAYKKTYLTRQLKSYLIWSFLYLPYGLFFLTQQNITTSLYPVALLVALLYVGVCYHLWYFPALFTGLWLTEQGVKRLGYSSTLIIALFLYFIGAWETYSGYLLTTGIAPFYHLYKRLFFTTRNGLFYAFIFTLLGFLIADFKQHAFFQKHLKWKLSGSLLLLLAEGGLIYRNPGDDKNFLLGLIPVSLFLVTYLLTIKGPSEKWHSLKIVSHYMFFLHPVFLETTKLLTMKLGYNTAQGVPLFIITAVTTTLTALALIKLKKYKGAFHLWHS